VCQNGAAATGTTGNCGCDCAGGYIGNTCSKANTSSDGDDNDNSGKPGGGSGTPDTKKKGAGPSLAGVIAGVVSGAAAILIGAILWIKCRSGGESPGAEQGRGAPLPPPQLYYEAAIGHSNPEYSEGDGARQFVALEHAEPYATPALGDNVDYSKGDGRRQSAALALAQAQAPTTTVEYAGPYASASGDIGMNVGASKKTGNSFYDVGYANYDSGGGSTSTPAEYAVPYESASGDAGNSVYCIVNNDDYDNGNGMAYSTTVGATPYEPLPANTDVEA
jgi:hypothetical protein